MAIVYGVGSERRDPECGEIYSGPAASNRSSISVRTEIVGRRKEEMLDSRYALLISRMCPDKVMSVHPMNCS